MDVTITYDEVYALVGMNIPSLEPRPNFERIRKLRRHFKNTLQRLPCPQSVQHGWKGMAMAQNMYALITTTPFRLPISPGETPRYVRAALLNEPINPSPLTRTEQATIDTIFKRCKNYYLSMQNIERVCFTALDSSVNDAFKLSNTPGVRGWHAGMTTVNILDQLSAVYGKPTAAALDANDMIFRSPYSAADAPEVLFRRIEDCAEIAMLGENLGHGHAGGGLDLGVRIGEVEAEACRETVRRAGWDVQEVDLWVFHQASDRSLSQIASQLGVPASRVPAIHAMYGNCESSSAALTLRHLHDTGVLQPGMKIMVGSAAAGFMLAALGVEWAG